MTVPLLIIVAGLFLLIAALGLFTLLVLAIRREDSRGSLAHTPDRPDELLARRLLGTHAHHPTGRR